MGKSKVRMGSHLLRTHGWKVELGREPRLLDSSSVTDGVLAPTLLVCELGQMT